MHKQHAQEDYQDNACYNQHPNKEYLNNQMSITGITMLLDHSKLTWNPTGPRSRPQAQQYTKIRKKNIITDH